MLYGLGLRVATNSDLQEMQKLFSDTISTQCANDYNKDQIGVWISSIEDNPRWLNKLSKQYFLIAELGNKIVGYGSIENGDYIDFMYVHKEYLRQGIAKTILKELENEALKCGSTKITSDVSKTAKPFFEKNGFTVVAENTNRIKGIEIVNYKMVKEL